MSTKAYDAYRTVRASTADPITLTAMLFDGGLKAMRKARLYHDQGNRERFLDETTRANLIIGELLATLDREAAGEVGEGMAAIYGYCIRCIVESTLGEIAKLDEAEKHFARIAEAWKQAAADYRASLATGRAEAAA